MKRPLCPILLVMFVLVVALSGGNAQDKKDDKKAVPVAEKYVLVVKTGRNGGDAVIRLVGIEYKVLASDSLKELAKPEVDGDKLIIRKRQIDLTDEPASYVTLKLAGTLKKTIVIGVPEGIPVYFGSKETPKKAEPPPKK